MEITVRGYTTGYEDVHSSCIQALLASAGLKNREYPVVCPFIANKTLLYGLKTREIFCLHFHL